MKEIRCESRGWGVPLLTERGVMLLLVGGVVPLAGIAAGMPAAGVAGGLLTFLGLLLGLFVRDLLQYRVMRKDLSLYLVIPPVLYSGSSAVVGVTAVPRREVFETGDLHARVVHPPGVYCTTDTISVDPLVSGDKLSGSCTVTPLERGAKEWVQILLRLRSRRSLLSFQWNAYPTEVARSLCLPNHVAGKMTRTNLQSTALSGERFSAATVSCGREFYALREYVVGDDLRRVEWKRSARGDSLFVKEYRPETHQRVAIAIDCGNTMSTAADGRVLLEYAADAASALSAMASYWKDDVAVLGFNHRLLQKTPFGKGNLHHQRVIQAITDLQVGDLESDYGILSSWSHTLSRRSLFIIISGMSSASRLEQLRPLLRSVQRRHLPLLLFMEDREVRRLADAGAGSIYDAFRSAAALYQREEMQRQVGILKSSGIPTLHVDAKQVVIELERTYQQFKHSGSL